MNVKINDKQQNNDRTIEEQHATTDVWRKYIPDELPDGRFWQNFSLTKISCYTVGRSLFNLLLSVKNTLLCMFQRLCTYFQDTTELILGGGGGGGGMFFRGVAANSNFQEKKGYLFPEGYLLTGFTVFYFKFSCSFLMKSVQINKSTNFRRRQICVKCAVSWFL